MTSCRLGFAVTFGLVFIVLGQPALWAQEGPLSTTPDWVVSGNGLDQYLGYSVASAGDVNADGFADVIVGCTGTHDPPYTRSRVHLYLGSAAGLPTTPAWTAYGEQLEGYWNGKLGYSVSSAGDVNGDGFDDVILGGPGWSRNCGEARVYLGSAGGLASTPVWTTYGGAYHGHAVTHGDVNGDGFDDDVVGAGGHHVPGKASVFHGSPAGPSAQPDWWFLGDDWYEVGEAVAAGDINGDGYDDVVVGAENRADTWIFTGSASGLSSTPTWILWENKLYFGYRLACGDLNGDGYADVIALTGGYDTAARAYFGSPSGPSLSHDWMIGIEWHPMWVATGDIDGDGFDDVLVGDYQFNNYSGRAMVFLGSESGPSQTPDWLFDGTALAYPGYFGHSLASAGDVNGDGWGELIVGSPNAHTGIQGGGRAYLFLGVASTPPDTDPPLVTIAAPGDGTITNTPSITVQVDVLDASPTTVVSTPPGIDAALPVGGGSVTGTVALVEGSNTLTVNATDSHGNTGGTSIAVTLDTIAPSVAIISPAVGTVFGTSPVSVTVDVADATGTTVAVGGSTYLLEEGGGQVIGNVTLVEGPNTIAIIVTDEAGNNTTIPLELVLDLTAPAVRIDSPAPGTCYGPGEEDIPVTATVNDLTATTVSSTPAGVSGSLDPGGGMVSGVVTLLTEGSNEVVVTAIDEAGRDGSASISVVLDTTPPVLAIDSPQQGEAVRGEIDYDATAVDVLPGSGVASVTLDVDGAPFASFTAGPFETLLDTTTLSDDWHTLAAAATDGKGNSALASLQVLVDNTAPAISITAPGNGAYVAGTINFNLAASDAGSGLVSISMHAGGVAPTGDDSVVHAMPVAADQRPGSENTTRWPDGPLNFSATAEDDAGNNTTATVTVTVDNIAVKVTPSALNLKSKGKLSVFAHLEGVSVGLLIPTEAFALELRVPGGNQVLAVAGFSGDDTPCDDDGDGVPELSVRFDRSELIASIKAGIAAGLIEPNSTVVVTLSANGGTTIVGSDSIKIVGG
ncbi:MAG: FG-GAP-like repeat-containing protein [Planctomycetota bacterium]